MLITVHGVLHVYTKQQIQLKAVSIPKHDSLTISATHIETVLEKYNQSRKYNMYC